MRLQIDGAKEVTEKLVEREYPGLTEVAVRKADSAGEAGKYIGKAAGGAR